MECVKSPLVVSNIELMGTKARWQKVSFICERVVKTGLDQTNVMLTQPSPVNCMSLTTDEDLGVRGRVGVDARRRLKVATGNRRFLG